MSSVSKLVVCHKKYGSFINPESKEAQHSFLQLPKTKFFPSFICWYKNLFKGLERCVREIIPAFSPPSSLT